MYFQILLSLVAALGLINSSYASNCTVSAPKITLSELHGGCYTDWRSRHPDCLAAMHRFCNRVDYHTQIQTIGISREDNNDHIGMSCVKTSWYGDVLVSDLQKYHAGCTLSKSQHRNCLSAIHRYCIDHLDSNYAAGISQEVGNNVFTIHCFIATHVENVIHNVLTNLHSGCIFPTSDSPQCFSASSRYCSQYFGYSGGITQEINTDIMTVACYNAEFSGDVFTKRITDFYEAVNDVDKVCSLNFTLAEGQILQTTQDVLAEECFDNRESEVEMSDVFAVSKSITLTHSFSHSHQFKIGAETTLKTGIPFVENGEIKLSASYSGGFSLTKENSKTITYEATSNVNIPRGEAITKSAVITRTNLKVPWTAKIVNKLGTIYTIGGVWYGEDAYNLRIVQEDMV